MGNTRLVAAIDIGTNSVKMTIAQQNESGVLNVIADKTTVTRLGRGVDATGKLNDDAIEKTLAALNDFARLLKTHQISPAQRAAVGTSALRDASNGAHFREQAADILGTPLTVASGDREAELIYNAVRRDPELNLPENITLAVSDIGGGSTEVILGTGNTVSFRQSLQIGAVRLTERTLPSNPPKTDELTNAQHEVETALAPVPTPDQHVYLVACGGTSANLGSMESLTPLHGGKLTLDQLKTRIESLSKQTIEERQKIPGLDPARADVILAGAIIQSALLHHLHTDSLTVSLRNLRYGLLYELLDLP